MVVFGAGAAAGAAAETVRVATATVSEAVPSYLVGSVSYPGTISPVCTTVAQSFLGSAAFCASFLLCLAPRCVSMSAVVNNILELTDMVQTGSEVGAVLLG